MYTSREYFDDQRSQWYVEAGEYEVSEKICCTLGFWGEGSHSTWTRYSLNGVFALDRGFRAASDARIYLIVSPDSSRSQGKVRDYRS